MQGCYFLDGAFGKQNWMELVYAPSDGNTDLFTVEAMHDMCRSEEHFVLKHLKPYAALEGLFNEQFYIQCRAFSLPFFIMKIFGKESCYDINNRDMVQMKSLLEMCYPLFKNGYLTEFPPTGGDVPTNEYGLSELDCYKQKYMYYLFEYILESDVVLIDKAGKAKLQEVKIAQMIVPNTGYYQNGFTDYFLDVIDGKNLKTGSVEIVGMFRTVGRKVALFSHYILQDVWLFGLAILLILLIMYLYLQSLLLVLATIANIAFAYIIAYFIYRVVLSISYFPFINLLSGLVIIAVAADDIFIFHDFWCIFKGNYITSSLNQSHLSSNLEMSRKSRSKLLAVIMTKTFKHASSSIFVTSFTTAAAFFSNCASNITSLKAFGLFSGIVILANFLLMITWTPAVIVACEKLRYTRACLYISNGKKKHFQSLRFVTKTLIEFFKTVECALFERLIPYLTDVFWSVMVILFAGLGVVGLLLLFYWPKLELPNTTYVPIYTQGSPIIMERYENEFNHRFPYGKSPKGHPTKILKPVHYIWGLQPIDNGRIFSGNASESATLIPDKSFNMTSMGAQLWLRELCREIQAQEFIDNTQKVTCMFDVYLRLLESVQIMQYQNVLQNLTTFQTCTGIRNFPIEPWKFELCLPILDSLVHSPNIAKQLGLGDSMVIGKPVYNEFNKPSGYQIPIYTTYHSSNDHEWMDWLYRKLDALHSTEMQSAPPGLQNGWWVVYPDFMLYDLQNAIETGVFYSIGISLLATMIVMFLTTLNFVITIYAILTISLAIISTLSALVLCGWVLNVIESLMLSLAVGLSIDFTIHYGVAYKLCKENQSSVRVRQASSDVGPAVLMACLTTFIAGLAMMPTRIVAFQQLGIFLMLIMTFSWLYATFFFQALLSAFGPNGDSWQLSIQKVKTLWGKLMNIGHRNESDSEIDSHQAQNAEHYGMNLYD